MINTLLIITLIAFAAFLFLTGFVVMADFSRLWLKHGREVFFGDQKGISYYSELATTLAVTFVIAVSIALFKGAGTILVSMATTSDIATFMMALRGVFSSYTTQLQSPQNHLLLFFVNPVLKMLAVFFLISGIKSFFILINKKAGGECYSEADALYFSSLGVLFLIALELLCHVQDVKQANLLSNAAYLLLDQYSYITYFLTIEEVMVLRSNKSKLNEAIDKYLVTSRIERRMVQSSWKMLALAYGLGLLLSLPCFCGFAWIRDNTALMSTFIMVLGVALFVMKKCFSDSWNLLGTVLLSVSSAISIPIKRLVLSNNKSRWPVIIGLIATAILLVVFGLFFPQLLFMLVIIISVAICLVALGTVLIYFLTMGVGFLVASIAGKDNTTPTAENSFTYMGWVLASLPKTVAVPALVVTVAFMAMTCFPKELKNEDIIDNCSVVDDHGNCLYLDTGHGQYFAPVRFEELPEFFKKALVAQEDRHFFQQNDLWPNTSNWHGISFSVFRGRGGSNINAQLCKNITFINSEGFSKDMSRKLSEIVCGYMVSRQMTPDEILAQYCNIASFHGSFGGFRGLNTASLYAFGNTVNQLNALQMLYLINSLPRSRGVQTENSMIPYHTMNKDVEGEVKKVLLKKAERWFEEGLITKKEYNTLKREELAFVNARYNSGIPVGTRLMLEDNFENHPGRHDCSMTLENERALASAYNILKTKNVFRANESELQVAAMVIEANTGRITGHFSSSEALDYANCYTYPVGSVLKPAIVLEILKSGVPIDFKLFDGKVDKRKTPRNSHGWSNVPVGVTTILSKSLNAPFSNLIDLGLKPRILYQNLESEYDLMGIAKDSVSANDTYNYPLGIREMHVADVAQVYQTIFNNGVFIPLSLEQTPDSVAAKRIWDEAQVKVVTNALNKTIENLGGTLNRYQNDLPQGKKYYGKTGTSSGQRDFWTVLSDGNLVIVCWASYGRQTADKMVLGTEKSWGASAAGLFSVLIYNELAKTDNHKIF